MSEEIVLGENMAATAAYTDKYDRLEMDELKSTPTGQRYNQDIFGNIPVAVTVMLGNTQVDLQKLLQLAKGDVIEMSKRIGESVDIMVNSQIIAQGEVVAVGENYGVKVTRVVAK
jgi:flagellar motor switch protein FliN/FliY